MQYAGLYFEIVDIILILVECHNNYRQAAVLYRNQFPHR